MTHISKKSRVRSARFVLIATFLICVFLTGGATRSDVQSLPLLRPLSVLFCAVALLTLHRGHMVNRKSLFVGFAAIFALAISHLIPLPPSIWQAMAGRQELIEAERLAGIVGTWRPLTVTPMNGLHALLSLFAPLAVLLLGVQLDRVALLRLLPLLIALGLLSGLVGLLQTLGGANSPLYFYDITNNGIPVGLFANRNHNAVLLASLLPMLAVYVSVPHSETARAKYYPMLAAGIALALVTLILISGSRSGLAVTIVAIIGAATLYRPSPVPNSRRQKQSKRFYLTFPALVALATLSLGFLAYFLSRAEAISRLFRPSAAETGRLEYWSASLDAFWKYFPWGSGSASFAEAYQTVEPDVLLSTNYLNRAHNDWLEVGVTFGLPGLALMALALTFFALQSFRIWRHYDKSSRSNQLARLGSVNLLILTLASISDYPLRTPIMMCCAVTYLLWFTWADEDGIRKGHGNNMKAGY